MSKILFLCTGNTCRSPIAEGIAKHVFGPSHTIVSAGAETGNGGSIAQNAVHAAKCLGIDISKQQTQDMAGLDLATFELIVIFRPSSAEHVELPAGVMIDYLDVDDPYGSSLDNYKIAARKIERGVRRLYVDDALRRVLNSPVQASSHLAGIFNRAAKQCEAEIAAFVSEKLVQSTNSKATLGQLQKQIKSFSGSKPELEELANAVSKVNVFWVNVKHRNDPPAKEFKCGLEAIKRVFTVLGQTS